MKWNTVDSFCPANQKEWRNWLELNHEKEDSIWLIMYKKNAPTPNLSWSQAVDEALCFGWIDSVKKSMDSQKYKHYYSKRKPNSIWSKINKTKVASLTDLGLMTKAGLERIAIAKGNGSWTRYDEVEALIVPKDLIQELKLNKDSKVYFEGLSKSIRKQLLYWIISAKRPETRQKRILDIVKNACLNQLPKQFR